jgi:hypothetical protein
LSAQVAPSQPDDSPLCILIVAPQFPESRPTPPGVPCSVISPIDGVNYLNT